MTPPESFPPWQSGRRPPFDETGNRQQQHEGSGTSQGYDQRAPARASHRGPAQAGRQVPHPGHGEQARKATARRDVAEEELPSWAGLGPEGNPARPSRGDRMAERRRKRRLLMACSGVVLIAVAVGGYLLSTRSGNAANVVSNDLITTFLPGEVQKVPNACTAPSSGTMQAYLPGKPNVVAPPLNGGLESQCSWTLDAAPVYRVVELDVHAYAPSGLASGDGSATFAAIDAFSEAQQAKQTPGKQSGIPAAKVTMLSNTSFLATQVFRSGTVTDVVTEVVRYRNVLVTVVVDGLQQTIGNKKYGPVSMSDLTAAAKAVAKDATDKVIH